MKLKLLLIIKYLVIFFLIILSFLSCKKEVPVKSITIVKPDQNTTYIVGDTLVVRWESSAIDYVKIELFKNGNLDREIKRGITNIGMFDWIILGHFEDDDDYKIRVSDTYDNSIYDDTDKTLTINNIGSSSIYTQVITPNGGEMWNANTSHAITWSTNYTGLMRVYLIYNNQIYGYITGTGTTDTTISTTFHGCAVGIPYKIRVCSATDYSLYGDESDDYFYLFTSQ